MARRRQSTNRHHRRSLAAACSVAAWPRPPLALLTSCHDAGRSVAPSSPDNAGSPAGPPSPIGENVRVGANVRVSGDRYGVHIEPSVAMNPRDPRQLLAASQVSPTADPKFLATYLSSDAGATWHSGGVPRLPAGRADGDDVTVAFDAHGRGYICATTYESGRAIYVWRTDDGGRSFSAPLPVLENQYCDHPWLATGQGRTPSEHNVYIVWGAGNSRTAPALDFTRSTDGGESFEPPRRILEASTIASMASAGPAMATGPDGLVCAVCDWTSRRSRPGT